MSSSQTTRDYRRGVILEILAEPESRIGSQLQLVTLLARRGINATQSNVSRDLQALRVQRINGRYQVCDWSPKTDPEFQRIMDLIEEGRSVGPYLYVVETVEGAGHAVGRAIQNAKWEEVGGVLSGENTIFIATASEEDRQKVAQRFSTFLIPVDESEDSETP
ncbi:MAG TPA: hypothetical protein VJ725_12155 [Thermoanaerobaculia bacterium]|nr:hypothetical protein [Thermoanaerobaculia bacterium]